MAVENSKQEVVGEWVDTHAHLDYEYPFSIDEYLERAAAVGIKTIVSVGANRPTWPTVQALVNNSAFRPERTQVYYSVGIHPHDAIDYNDDVIADIRSHATHERCVAVGEIGLDYHYDHSPREVQQAACQSQLTLALELKKPVIIHSRDGEDDLLALLQDYAKRHRALAVSDRSTHPGVLHCFSGTRPFAQACVDLGFYLSFSGILTFKKAEEVRAAAAEVPLERILVETDAPYLAPVPHRGKSNESAYMIETCRTLAEIKGISLLELSRATTANARELFNIK